ncbi:hypothetical protein D5086_024391 [Populus alba]
MPMKYFSYQYNDQIRMILAFDGSGEPGEFSFLFLPLRLIESQGTQKSVGCPNDHPGGIPLNSHLVLALPLPLPRLHPSGAALKITGRGIVSLV